MVQKMLKLTLIKSTSGRLAKHKATVASLGLRRIRQSVQVADSTAVRGMINKVSYLLAIEEVK